MIYLLIMVLASVITLCLTIPFIHLISSRYQGATESIKAAFRLIKSLFIPALITSILTWVSIFGGLLLIVLPGIIFGVWFSFTIYEVVLGGVKPTHALAASRQLVRGRWWGVMWRLFFPSFIILLIVYMLTYVFTIPFAIVFSFISFVTALLFHVDPFAGAIFMSLVFIAVMYSIIAIPLIISAITILYVELKKTSVAPPTTPEQPTTP